MKITSLLLVSFLILSVGAIAGTNDKSEYFICHFNKCFTEFELDELKEDGFHVFEQDSTSNIVYVKAKKNHAQFSKQLKEKMKELIMVDKNGNRTYIVETVTEDSPEFLKLFFNFI
ncbi:hypothetical protein KFE94_00730 [bacterium SCSIO 12643]|nr:hypothetical protein KFE94_00730 [bacterium SCSIO 12643]